MKKALLTSILTLVLFSTSITTIDAAGIVRDSSMRYGDAWGATAILIACCCILPILAIPLCVAFFYWHKSQFKKFQEKEAKKTS